MVKGIVAALGAFAMLAIAPYAAAPARAALVLTGPGQVAPGQSFAVTLALTAAWPLATGEVVDQVDVTLSYDASAFTFDSAAEVGLFLDGGIAVLPGELTTALFAEPRTVFGPGSLLEYRFVARADAAAILGSISADVVPSMIVGGTGDLTPVSPLPPAQLSVQVIPEPSTWLMLVAGALVVLVAARRRAGVAPC